MIFRPYPILTLIAIPALAALISLGVWQLQRAEWKAGLIADFEAQAQAAPERATIVCDARRAVPEGTIISDPDLFFPAVHGIGPTLRMFGANDMGVAGWTLLAVTVPPCVRPDGMLIADQSLLVDVGFEGLSGEQSWTFPNRDTRYVVADWPDRGPFALRNDPIGNDWHWFDAPAMKAALTAPELQVQYYLRVFTGVLPVHLARTPPATHYGYAITWFGMAIAFVVIYALFHARAGRLRFRKRA